jgi:hypothetical protein
MWATKKNLGFYGLIFVWLVVVLGGMAYTWRYKTIPGIAASAPPRWPSSSSIVRTPGRPMLLVLAHPHCPCTRATISELARLEAVVGKKIQTVVLFLKPKGVPSDWAQTSLWNSVSNIDQVQVRTDPGGKETALFGTHTSGQMLFYDAVGNLQYSGGLTIARGHEGTSSGFLVIEALVRGEKVNLREAPVFGCSMDDKVMTKSSEIKVEGIR